MYAGQIQMMEQRAMNWMGFEWMKSSSQCGRVRGRETEREKSKIFMRNQIMVINAKQNWKRNACYQIVTNGAPLYNPLHWFHLICKFAGRLTQYYSLDSWIFALFSIISETFSLVFRCCFFLFSFSFAWQFYSIVELNKCVSRRQCDECVEYCEKKRRQTFFFIRYTMYIVTVDKIKAEEWEAMAGRIKQRPIAL